MKKLTIILLITVLTALMVPGVVFAKGPGANVTQITGVVQTIDAATLQVVVGDYVVQATQDTQILLDKSLVSFDGLKVGMTVTVCGHMDGDILIADQINIMYKGK